MDNLLWIMNEYSSVSECPGAWILFLCLARCGSPPVIYHAQIVEGEQKCHSIYECDIGFMFSDGTTTYSSSCLEDFTWNVTVAGCVGIYSNNYIN